MYSFLNLEPVHCSMSSSKSYFLTCIQISQKAGNLIWYSHLFKNLPQFVVIHSVKDFSKVHESKHHRVQLCDPVDYCSLPGSSVHRILLTRIPELVAIPFSRESSQPWDQTQGSLIADRFFTFLAARNFLPYNIL